jgi:hypothetical protein
MNTKKIYISSLSRVIHYETNESSPIALGFEHLKYVLVKIDGKKFRGIDLNTDELYRFNMFGNYILGKLYLNPNYIRSFNHVTGNKKKYLSKKKILDMFDKLERYK